MSRQGRAISTVADTTLAILLVVAAVAMLVGFADGPGESHGPIRADHTAETVGAATIDTTYHLESAVLASHEDVEGIEDIGDVYEESAYERADLRRVAHGPIAGEAANVAVTNATFETRDGRIRLSQAGVEYAAAVEEAIQTALVASSFHTRVQAVWEPLRGGSIRGTAAFGKRPPASADVGLATLTVPSGMPAARSEAAAVADDVAANPDANVEDGIERIAGVVSGAIVEGYLPVRDSQRALERTGVERALVVYRYERLVTAVDGIERGDIAPHLERTSADAAAANDRLRTALGQQLETDLLARHDRGEFDGLADVAELVATGQVTITVSTWDP
jgi:hypothetical protein